MRVRPLGLVVRGGLLLFTLWLYGGDLIRWGRAQSAGVAAFTEMPSLLLSVLGTAVAIGGAGVLVLAARAQKAFDPRGLRLLSAALVTLFFADFVVLSSGRSPLTAPERLAMAIESFTEGATSLGAPQSVVREPALLDGLLDQLGPVPLFEHGTRVARWKLELRERCAGPVLEAGAAGPGTLFYCVSGDHQRAWVTVVGLARDEVFAERASVVEGAGWVGEVQPLPAEPPPVPEAAPLPEQPVWGSPTEDAPE